jgi:hypothetical protein
MGRPCKADFQVHGALPDGKVAFGKKLSHLRFVKFLAEQPPCLIAMEACATAHYWRREALGKTSAQFKIPSGYQILYALENHIWIFMDIFIYESARRVGDQNVLRKVDALMDWSLVLPLLKSGLNRSGLGPQ